jgi:hypothetical protein
MADCSPEKSSPRRKRVASPGASRSARAARPRQWPPENEFLLTLADHRGGRWTWFIENGGLVQVTKTSDRAFRTRTIRIDNLREKMTHWLAKVRRDAFHAVPKPPAE